MIRIILFISFLLPLTILAQYGNEWINYSQNYYSFPIAEDGIYRISKSELRDAGMDIDNIDPRSLQIYAKGDEQFIYINGENDGSFDDSDYIEFYGQKNDGYLDSLLYENPDHQVNPYFSIYNDTLRYYITFNSSTDNKRYSILNDGNTTGVSPITSHRREFVKHYGDETEYHFGPQTSAGTEIVGFNEGEGFVSRKLYKGDSKTETIDLGDARIIGGLNYNFEAKLIGQSNDVEFNPDHNTSITLNGNQIADLEYDSRELQYVNTTGAMTDLSSSFDVVFQSDASFPSTVDTWSVAYFKLMFHHGSDFTDDSEVLLMIDDQPGGKAYVQLSNYDNAGNTTLFYDLTNGLKISVQSGGTPFVLIPNTAAEKQCFLTHSGLVRSVGDIEPINGVGGSGRFTNYSNRNNDYIIITHDLFTNGAQEYANYRTTTGFSPIVVEVDEIYHQFGEGVFRHPHSIRRFCQYAEENWNVNPEYLLIIGKGVFDNGSFTVSANTRGVVGYNYVPTYGSPGSDQLFTAGLENNFPGDYKPSMATGRISCITNSQVTDYLNKIIDNENNTPELWMKNILHFAGGGSEAESQTFQVFLNQMKDVIEDTLFGGNVRTFVKFDTNPMTIDVGDSLRNAIEDGVSIMNFMGHASGSNFDYAIDDPNSYANEGKNPLFMGVSCNVGNMYGRTTTSGIENYVHAGQRGAIGFIASSTLSIATYGNALVRSLYEQFSGVSYGESVGHGMIGAINDIQNSNVFTRNTALTMNLHGDPAYVVNMYEKPDYTVYSDTLNTAPTVYTIPSVVTTEVDSFDLAIEMANLGKAVDTTFWVAVTRSYPGIGLPDTTYQVQVENLYYRDTIYVRMPVDFINGIGINNINVRLDFFDDIDELDNTFNNVVNNFTVLVTSGSLVPIYPYDYAVIEDPITSLITSSGDIFAPARDYVFQIDTSDSFFESSTIEYRINQSGGIVEWNVNESSELMSLFSGAPDSSVFFWRVSLDTNETDDGDYSWRETSFQYIPGKQGWGQDHFRQFKNNSYDLLKFGDNQLSWDFADNIKRVNIKTNRFGGSNIWDVGYWVDNIQRHSGVVSPAGWIHMGVMDGKSLESWSVYDYYFNNYNDPSIPGRVTEGFNSDCFMYHRNDWMLMFDVLDSAQVDDYFLYFTRKGVSMQNWGQEYKDILGSYGVDTSLTNYQRDSLGNVDGNLSIIFFGRKGHPTETQTIMGGHRNDYLEMDTSVASTWTQGVMVSSLIGPSAGWREIHWDAKAYSGEDELNDSMNIEVIGIDLEGNEVNVFDSTLFDISVLDLESRIDARQYPYMKFKATFVDTINNTPMQMDNWHVLFDEVPEAALNPQIAMDIPDSTTQEGFDYTFTFSVENISNADMDSLQVKYWILDKNNTTVLTSFERFAPLLANSFITDTISISTLGLVGSNSIWLEINPYDGPVEWQAERYHFNNLTSWEFDVISDDENPLLDVTFDGVHILNGDIVSPSPSISIKLDDDNQFLALNDTSLFEVYVTYPDDISVLPTRIYFSTADNPQNLLFTPASLPENKATIEYNPIFDQNGEYTLLVRGKDRSANISGSGEDGVYDYRIDFEVINESSVTNVLNYPNPFSSHTQFVFTLTGEIIPDQFRIQIMSVTGKVVKEITRDEIGNLQIGRNVTEYRWDGTDNFGDKLANGVYFYKVFIGSNGESFEQRESGADQYFHKGFGKLYIMR